MYMHFVNNRSLKIKEHCTSMKIIFHWLASRWIQRNRSMQAVVGKLELCSTKSIRVAQLWIKLQMYNLCLLWKKWINCNNKTSEILLLTIPYVMFILHNCMIMCSQAFTEVNLGISCCDHSGRLLCYLVLVACWWGGLCWEVWELSMLLLIVLLLLLVLPPLSYISPSLSVVVVLQLSVRVRGLNP